jgi:preprotein translocase subunit SecA
MVVSPRYKQLYDRLAELRKHLLPDGFSPTGDYSDRQMDSARGYRILVHAEIESYLEDVVKDVVLDCIKLWKENRRPSSLLVAFLASYHSSWNVNDDTSSQEIIQKSRPRRKKDSVNEIIDLAQAQFIAIVKKNHGVREKNFKSLILPTGVDIDELDQTWLTDLDNFGGLRGDIAHNAKRTTDQINPKDEYNRVISLLDGLKDLDILILKQKETVSA